VSSQTPFSVTSSRRLAVAALVLFGAHAAVLLGLGTDRPGPFLSDLMQLALGITLIVASLQAARRSDSLGRYFWQRIAFGYSLWALAQTAGVCAYAVKLSPFVQWWMSILFSLWFVPLGIFLFLNTDSAPRLLSWTAMIDFIQAMIFWVVSYLYLFRIPSELGPGLAHSVWAPYFVYYGVLTVAFYLRSVLARGAVARALLHGGWNAMPRW
jgi:hypothetical protein